MTAPLNSVSQFPYPNPHASQPLLLTLIAVPNTSAEQIASNVVSNSALPLEWLLFKPKNYRPAILVGGGPSAADDLDEIRFMKGEGGIVYAMNGASRWLREHGIVPDWQVIADAQEESASLADPKAKGHLFSSAVNPATMDAVPRPIVWHPVIGGIEQCFPEHRRTAEYTIIGGTSTGTHAMCIAYVMGHREIHCFGYDSSHRDGESHAYRQAMNDSIPTVRVEWAGRTYLASIAMKAQAEHFQLTARALQDLGCEVHVHGSGLLPAMWNTPVGELSERDKYRRLWSFDTYRVSCPGEQVVSTFLEVVKPKGRIIDFGCGTGRAALALEAKGHNVILVDFADNCRDQEAIRLPFVEHDLMWPLPFGGECGFCSDVMEHIPPDGVETVLGNIMAAVPRCFFRIDCGPDMNGALIGETLHLSQHSFGWWKRLFADLEYSVEWSKDCGGHGLFVVTQSSQTGK